MSNFLLIGLIVVVWLVVLAPLLLRSQKPIRKAGEAFDDTRVILEGGSSVPMRRRPRLGGDTGEEDDTTTDREDEEYELEDSPSIFRHRREGTREDSDRDDRDDRDNRDDEERTGTGSTALSAVVAAADTATTVTAGVTEPAVETDDQAEDEVEIDVHAEVDVDEETLNNTDVRPDVEVIAEWNAEDHYALDDSYNAPIDLMHHEERVRAIADYRAAREAGATGGDHAEDTTRSHSPEEDNGELTQADMEFAARRRGRGYYDPQADREFAHNQHIRRQRTLLGLGVAVVVTVILGFVLGGGVWALPAVAVAMTALYLVALRRQVRAENELRARRIRRLRRSRMGVRSSGELPPRLRRPGAVVLELDDESPDFEGLDTTYLPVEDHDDGYGTDRIRRVS
ncbi:hypothetical protein HMPREF0290_1497 [Corynebacterium efficiens YS-314]|uniref:Uncharacterized protein n=1 Tax=Corynebacterium efficiens (strain DSM 44549 / YS-314 / AJ 12310 / JCM 11189 / NBRC 100395) TaxID=196164 RepID=Q8FR08_COREF|nr:gephyrin-like molybdotransferase receptor GlpR [Corynebacterium efficiens]EEW49909.1 hypothetical protein HMPREF0290_1497 [Corynebacterium efficiens YS-314]BAC17769.1 conserved hypothetical protein [Corynebacterium efficiens YS-314]